MDAYRNDAADGARHARELRLRAHSVSRGIAFGTVVCLYGKKRQFYRIPIKAENLEREVRRFRSAIRLARMQLKQIARDGAGKRGDASAGIFEVHQMILEDPALLSQIEEMIREQRINAEWAVKLVTDTYINKLKAIPDEHLRARYVDMEDIAERIVTALGGGNRAGIRLERDSVIVAKELNPSTLMELRASHPAGVVTEHGGWTSHTFILAREVDLPAVTGIKRVLRRVRTGDSAIVDGFRGELIINPNAETVRQYRTAALQHVIPADQTFDDGPLKTLDGREIIIRANADIPAAYKEAKKLGAKGIGLYRSEFLFNQFRGFPTEAVQVASYRKIASLAQEDGIKIRTFDLHTDQLVGQNAEKEKNPALGLRAVRLSFAYEKEFRTQLRAILIASADAKIDIVLPMVSDVSQLRAARAIIESEKALLLKKNIKFGAPLLGAMIEVPSAILTIDNIAAESDFLCLGTNDLVQYILAVDRDNEAVADWFHTLHPAVIRAIKISIDTAARAGKALIVCGEMAGSPFYTPILLGLGAVELSMNFHSIARVRHVISSIAYEEARELVKVIEKSTTAEENDQLLLEHIDQKWRHVFETDGYPFLVKNRQ